MPQIIFHSDDAGSTSQVTRRIMAAWSAGLIDGFSVLANGDSLFEVLAALQREPEREARIAVHLNLCEGKSLAYPLGETLLSDRQGFFSARFGGLLKRWLLSSKTEKARLIHQVETEWRAQIELLIERLSPRPVRVLDGHMHMHMLPFLFPLAARLAAEYHIPEIRLSDERFHLASDLLETLSPSFGLNLIKHLVLRICSRANRKYLKKYGLAGPDVMVGILYTGRMTALSARKGIEASHQKCVEVLFHIGRGVWAERNRWDACPDIGQFYLSDQRDREYEELLKLKREFV